MSATGLRSLLVVMDRAFDPIGMVMGAGTFQIWRPTTCSGFALRRQGEPLVYVSYETALRDAWATVIARLEADATAKRAHGVLGVAVTASWTGGAGTMQQFSLQLLGTAVRLQGQDPLPRPFLSTLSMQDFLKLLLAGWAPVGIGWGVAAVHVHGWDASPTLQGAMWSNAEMEVPTAGVRLTRSRLEEQARVTLGQCRAEGAVAVRLELERRDQACGSGNGVLIDGLLLGTGVVRYRSKVAVPHLALNLSKKGRP